MPAEIVGAGNRAYSSRLRVQSNDLSQGGAADRALYEGFHANHCRRTGPATSLRTAINGRAKEPSLLFRNLQRCLPLTMSHEADGFRPFIILPVCTPTDFAAAWPKPPVRRSSRHHDYVVQRRGHTLINCLNLIGRHPPVRRGATGS